MKNENNDARMTKFVGLRAKMYMVRVDDALKKDTKKAKGIKNNVVARTITFDNYTQCLNEEIKTTHHQYDLNYMRYTRYPNRKSLWVHTMTNDT